MTEMKLLANKVFLCCISIAFILTTIGLIAYYFYKQSEYEKIIVSSKYLWTKHDTLFKESDVIEIKAGGKIRWNNTAQDSEVSPQGGEWTPNQTAKANEFPCPNWSVGCLFAGIASKGDYKCFVYKYSEKKFPFQIIAPKDGYLFFGINDNDVSDNSGTFKVKIKRVRRLNLYPIEDRAIYLSDIQKKDYGVQLVLNQQSIATPLRKIKFALTKNGNSIRCSWHNDKDLQNLINSQGRLVTVKGPKSGVGISSGGGLLPSRRRKVQQQFGWTFNNTNAIYPIGEWAKFPAGVKHIRIGFLANENLSAIKDYKFEIVIK